MITIQDILLPTDFSEPSDAAFRYAISLAQAIGARLSFLHIPVTAGHNFEASFPFAEFETAPRERLASVLNQEEIAQLRPEYALRVGTPAAEIVRYAEARGIDLIIMGTHGRSGVAHLVMGSVAEQVVRTAPCPVLLVRHSKSAAVTAPAMVRIAEAT
jgi:universal stress protein A